MLDDLHARLVAALRARLEVARAATPGPWTWGPIDLTRSGKLALTGPGMQPVVKAASADLWPSTFDATFIAANDPATEIRRVEALLRVAERHVPPVMIGNAPAVCDFCIDAGITDWPCPDIRDLAAGEGIEDA